MRAPSGRCSSPADSGASSTVVASLPAQLAGAKPFIDCGALALFAIPAMLLRLSAARLCSVAEAHGGSGTPWLLASVPSCPNCAAESLQTGGRGNTLWCWQHTMQIAVRCRMAVRADLCSGA